MKTLLILGATGQVGQQIVAQALVHPEVKRIIAPTRRALPRRAKLQNPVVDFTRLPADARWWSTDAALCALGTTLRQAGSADAFRQIDHDIVLVAAQLARQAGTPVFVYNSSIGANVRAGTLYLRVKGETERDLATLGYASLCHVRPSLLDAEARPDVRLAERAALMFARGFAPLIPARYRAISTRAVAAAMLDAALHAQPGVRIIESDALHR